MCQLLHLILSGCLWVCVFVPCKREKGNWCLSTVRTLLNIHCTYFDKYSFLPKLRKMFYLFYFPYHHVVNAISLSISSMDSANKVNKIFMESNHNYFVKISSSLHFTYKRVQINWNFQHSKTLN